MSQHSWPMYFRGLPLLAISDSEYISVCEMTLSPRNHDHDFSPCGVYYYYYTNLFSLIRWHRMEPPIALAMGIPTSQTFFPSHPASHTCFLPTSRLLVIITLWTPTSLLENSLSRPPISQMNFKSPPAPSPDFGQTPASQMHCPPPVYAKRREATEVS